MQGVRERRKFIRLEIPADLEVIFENDNTVYRTATKNVSAEGIRFNVPMPMEKGTNVKIEMFVPSMQNPVHIHGKVAWAKRLTIEDGAPYDIGVEFGSIEEDNKNTFLKFLCDTIYDQIQKMGGA